MWFTRLAITRPILIWMVLAAIAILGLKAYTRLPAELNPRVDIPTLTITTLYPDAGPAEIESQVTKPIEDVAGTIGGVKDVYSSSQPNISIVSVDFLVGTNLDAAAAELRGRIEAARAELPSEARPPIVAKLDINAQPILYLGFVCPSLDLQQLRILADNTMRPRLQRVAGVAVVSVVGGAMREVQVSVDGQKLGQYGLTIEDVVNSLKAAGHDVPGGGITAGQTEISVRLAGAFTTLSAIRNTQILAPQLALQSMPNAPPAANSLPAPPLTVADVATVTVGAAERTQINRINGREGVSLIFTKSSDSNTVTVIDGINRVLEQLRPQLPRDMKRITLRDDSVSVRGALDDVDTSLVLGAILAMVVILFFLHNLRGTFIVSLAIPTCIVATFLVMWGAGFTLNQMTLLALSLSVGILVDDSIVILESITRHLSYGETPREAAYNGRTEIGFADITTTLVDVVVFVPIAFMGGIVGGFFKQFGLTIVCATLFSLLISFSVTPMLASRWYKSAQDVEAKRGFFAPFERFYKRLELLYRRVIRLALRHRALVLGTGVVALVGIFWLSFTRLGFEFMPGFDQGQISIDIEMPPGSSLAATDGAARRIEGFVGKLPDVAAVVTTVGQVVAGFGHIPEDGPQFAQVNLRLRAKAGLLDRLLHPVAAQQMRDRSDLELTELLRAEIKGVVKEIGGRVKVVPIRSVGGLDLPVEIQLRGADVDELAHFAEQVRDKMSTVHGVLDPDVSMRTGEPEVRAVIDRRRAAQYGVPVAMAGAILRDSVTGNTDAVFREGGLDFPIRIQLVGFQRDDPADVANIVVGTDAQQAPITLADIADITRRTGPTSIQRLDGQRLALVNSNLTPDVALGNIQQIVQKQIDAIPHPNIQVKWGGDAEIMNENAVYFASALILAVILVYIVMASLFNNLGTPFVIMFTLPMALVGALGALVLMGETFTLVSAIGVIMLVGLMGRNAILLLDFTNTLRARGEARNQALEDAGAIRLRPILMTTTATIAGMLPVALRIGKASEVRAPMAIVVIGGLLVSTLLTLVVIPVLYSLFDDWFGRKTLTGGTALPSGPLERREGQNGHGERERTPEGISQEEPSPAIRLSDAT